MPRYTIQSDDGNTLTLEGDSPPTEQELEELFSQHGQTQMAPTDVPQGIESYQSDQSMSPEQFRSRDLAIRTRARTSDAPEFSRANEQGIAFNEIMPKFGVREMLTASASMPMGIGLDPYPKPTEQTIKAAEKVPALQLAAGAVQGTGEIIGGVGQYLTSPQGVVEIALSKTALAPVVMFKWAKDMVESGMVNTAEAIEAYKRKDWPELGRLVANATGMIAGAAGVAHGGVQGARPVIESGVRAVHELTPGGKVSRAERVEAGQWLEGHMQRMAERTALERDPNLANDPAKQERLDQIITQQEQIGLSEPHQKILDEQAKALTGETGLPVEVVWGSENRKPGQTFGLKRGPNGGVVGIEAHGENVPGWMESVAKAKRGAATGRVLQEEFIHSATDPADADIAYESSSALERKVAEKNYGRKVGDYGRELTPVEQGLVDKVESGKELTTVEAQAHKKIPRPMSSRDLGYEILRQRAQKMSGGTREAVEASFEDRLDINALDAIASMVRGIREKLGPRGRAGAGKAAFDRTLANIEASKAAKLATARPGDRVTTSGEPPIDIESTTAGPGEVTPDAADLALEELGVDPGEFDIEPSDNMGLLRQLEDEISQGPDPRNRPAKGNHLSDRDKFRAKQEQFEKLKAQEMDRLMRDNPAAVQKDLFSDPDKKKILTDSLWAKMRAAAGGDQKITRKAEAQVKEQALRGKELPGDNPAAIDTRTGVEEEIPKLPAGDRLVTIERPDGTTYQAAFGDKYWDFPGRGRIESIAKPVNGSWSHGIIGKGEKIVDTADNPAATFKQKQADKLADLRRAAAEGREAPGLKGPGVQPNYTAVAKEERVGPGITSNLTPADLERAASRHLSGEIKVRPLTKERSAEAQKGPPRVSYDRPTFDEFSNWAERNMEGVKPAQLRDLWEDKVWSEVLKASPERLEDWRRALGLEKAYGKQELKADIDTRERFEVQLGLLPQYSEIKKVSAPDKEAKSVSVARNKYRNKLATAIVKSLVRESIKDRPDLSRTEITTDDIDFGNTKTKVGPYRELGRDEISDPQVLNYILRDQARASSTDLESATRRLVAVVDKNGQVDLLSTYSHAGVQRVTDPTGPKIKGRPNRELNSGFLRQYRPFASVLLSDPVQGFHQRFESVSEFMDKIGREALERSRVGDFPGEGSAEGFEAEGSPGLEGEGGTVMGPEAGPARAAMGIGRGAVAASRGVPMTGPEAASIIDHVIREVGRIESTADIDAAISALKDETNPVVLSGYRKLIRAVQDQNPDMDVEQLRNKLSDQIYENYKTSETGDQFIARTLAQAGTEPAGETAAPKASKTSQELTTPGRRMPIPGTGGPPLRGITGQAARISRAEAESGATARAEAVTGDIQAAPQELGRGDVELLKSDDLKRAAIAESYGRMRKKAGRKMLFEAVRDGLITQSELYQIQAGKIPQRTAPGTEGAPVKSSELLPSEGREYVGSRLPEERYRGSGGITGFPFEDNPAAISKKASEEFGKLKAVVGAQFKRREAEQNIVRWRDAADNTANITARASGNSIRVRAKNPQARAAAKAMIAAGYDQGRLPGFLDQINNGIAEANALIQSSNPVDKRAGRLWLKAAQKLKQEVEYANAHWNDEALRGAALQTSREMANEFKFETANGIDLKQSPDYIPGRYDAELFNDNSVMFGEQRILGRNYRKPKTFPNYYAAIAEGPYLPKSYDVAELVEHRVRQGRREINKTLWLESLKTLKDPDSGLSVVADAVKREGKWVSPGPEHELFSMGPGKEPVAVRQGYKNLLDVLTMQSTISKTLPGKVALAATGFLKHGVILILDTFHPGRLFQYAAALHGTEAGYRGGFSALEYRDADLPRAVAQGYITPESAQWAAQPVNVRLANGKMGTVTRRQILELGTKNGLNVGRIQDALYKDLVRNWPVIGKVNNWVFDKMTRGLMSEAFVREFERLNDTEVDPTKLAGKVAKELNIYYGSLGRQGWIRNPTFRDISQILFLAPQWVEGLIQKEARFYGRLAAAPVRMAKGEGAMMGTIGRGVGRGLLSYFVLTQVMNLITRRQTTFQNEEEGHKLDAWIPTGGGDGFWLSPLSVFGEITHDVMRYGESKPNTAEAIRKIGENKLGPWGKLALVFATRENPQGERLTTTASIAGSMGAQLMPTPISLGVPVRSALHTVAPSLVRPPPKGSLPRQMLGSVGIKVQPSSSSVQQINSMASHWVDKNKLRHTGSVTTPTDDPSYSKLRSALLNKDTSTAESAYKFLLETRTRKEVEDEMEQWSNRGFTGLKKEHEDEFRESLNKRDYERYQKAKADKEDLFEKFRDFAIGVR